jgi:hypothetical protein
LLLPFASIARWALDFWNPFMRKPWLLNLRLDFLVEGKIVVELKAVSRLEDIHFAIGRSYLKAISLQDGLLFNFATTPLTIKRFCRERAKSTSP